MKQYKIFKDPAGKIETVKQGWSWPAFLFGVIWAFAKRLYGLGSGILLAIILISMTFPQGDEPGVLDLFLNLASFAIAAVFGAKGNLWREKNLAKRGYGFMDTVSAANPEGAAALYQKQVLSAFR